MDGDVQRYRFTVMPRLQLILPRPAAGSRIGPGGARANRQPGAGRREGGGRGSATNDINASETGQAL